MTAPRHTSSWTLTVAGIAHSFDVLSGRIKLDERNLIYGEGLLVVAPVPDSVLDDLDPTEGDVRATVTATRTETAPGTGVSTRTFELLVVRRERLNDQSVELELMTDEALLAIRARVNTEDDDIGGDDGTARDVINATLTAYADGGTLLSGALNADLSRLVSLRNIVGSGSFETAAAVAGWSGVSTSAVVQSSTQAYDGTFSLRFTASAATTAVQPATRWAVTLGKQHQLVYSIRPTTNNSQLSVRCYDQAGVFISTVNFIPVVTFPTSWNAESFIIEPGLNVPANTATIEPRFVVNSATVGALQYLDAVAFWELPESVRQTANRPAGVVSGVLPYKQPGFWNGAHALTADYSYAWEGTAHAPASVSVRTALVDRDHRLTVEDPGVIAREFLNPIIAATGGRLFCDEARDWRLVDNTYTVSGTVTIEAEVDLLTAVDRISISDSVDGVPTNFTGVVLIYLTTDPATGRTTRSVDKAGTSAGRVFVRTFTSPYPGAGAADAILARAQGRLMPITALTDYAATPGKTLALTANGDDYTGRISAVEWVYDNSAASDTMALVPRDLVPA